MQQAEPSELENCCTFFMQEGSAVHLPLGSIPIFLGIRPEVELDAKMDLTAANKAAKEKHTFSFFFDPKQIQNYFKISVEEFFKP